MGSTFGDIRHRLQKFRTLDVLDICYEYMASLGGNIAPVWDVFLLMKWTHLYAEKKRPYKKFTTVEFNQLVNDISQLNKDHFASFAKKGDARKMFQIILAQQLYLQKSVYKEVYATQLKVFSTLTHKYDLEKSFMAKTGISIRDFLVLTEICWACINANKIGVTFRYEGFLPDDLFTVCREFTTAGAVEKYLQLMVLHTAATEQMELYKRGIKREDLQSLETSFFTMYPLQRHRDKIRVIHAAVFSYSINYYLYDYLKANDEGFGSEFGKRFEKYIELGLNEASIKYKTENDLKKLLPKDSNLTDFMLEEENILIECKVIELQPFVSINPTDELLYSSLKDNLIKAYLKQMLYVANTLLGEKENWGIILTYKQLFWSKFTDVWDIITDKTVTERELAALPPENVFIVDVYTWNKIVQVIKDKKATLLDILKKAKQNNSKPETSKQLFDMHLQEYDVKKLHLTFLQPEIKKLDF